MSSSDLSNAEAENFLLAAILRYPEEHHVIVGNLQLNSDDFVNTETRRIAGAIDRCIRERREPTLPNIVEALKLAGQSDSIEYLSRLTSLPCSVESAIGYARTVKSLSVNRQLGNAGAKIIEISREKRTDVESAVTEAEGALRKIISLIPNTDRSPDPKDILARMRSAEIAEGIPLYFAPTLQFHTGGLRPAEMWAIGGFSSTGKSAFAANLVLDILLSRNKKVALFNIEMSQEAYMIRFLAIKSGIPQRVLRDRVSISAEHSMKLDEAERFMARSNLRLYDTTGTIAGIKNEARKLRNREGLDVVVVDYIQSIRGTRGEEVSDAREIAIELQALAKELGVCVVAFSQVSNQYAKDDIAEQGKGDFYSFKGHGAIRDNADVALMLRRNRRSKSPLLDVQIAKNRHGDLAEFTCWMDLPTGKITEKEDGFDEDEE